MKTKDKPTETALEESADPIAADRSVAIEATLQPLNLALDTLRSEAAAFTQARQAHAIRLENLKTQKDDQEAKLKTLEGLQSDESVVDVSGLNAEIASTIGGIGTLTKRLEKAESEAPGDDALRTSWQNVETNFAELHSRMIDYYKNLFQQERDKIDVSQSEALTRVHELFLNPDDVETAERVINAIASELDNIKIEKLSPYVDPATKAAAAAAEDRVWREKWDKYDQQLRQNRAASRSPVAPATSVMINPGDVDYPFDGFAMSRGMMESIERNNEQVRKWREEGKAPRTRQL